MPSLLRSSPSCLRATERLRSRTRTRTPGPAEETHRANTQQTVNGQPRVPSNGEHAHSHSTKHRKKKFRKNNNDNNQFRNTTDSLSPVIGVDVYFHAALRLALATAHGTLRRLVLVAARLRVCGVGVCGRQTPLRRARLQQHDMHTRTHRKTLTSPPSLSVSGPLSLLWLPRRNFTKCLNFDLPLFLPLVLSQGDQRISGLCEM